MKTDFTYHELKMILRGLRRLKMETHIRGHKALIRKIEAYFEQAELEAENVAPE